MVPASLHFPHQSWPLCLCLDKVCMCRILQIHNFGFQTWSQVGKFQVIKVPTWWVWISHLNALHCTLAPLSTAARGLKTGTIAEAWIFVKQKMKLWMDIFESSSLYLDPVLFIWETPPFVTLSLISKILLTFKRINVYITRSCCLLKPN